MTRRVDEVQETESYWIVWSSLNKQPITHQFQNWYPKEEISREQAIQQETEL